MGVVFRNGKLNDAKLVGGVPVEPYSLIGVVHRVLRESGCSPCWTATEGEYRSFVGRGDIFEVTI